MWVDEPSLSEATRRAGFVAAQHPILLYWLPALLMLAGLATLLLFTIRVRPTESRRTLLVAAVGALALLSLMALRWPTLALFEQNPDESQILAGTITLAHDPVYWRSVDNGTHGPLVAFSLMPARALGLALDYAWARLVGLLMMWGIVMSLYGVVRRLTSEVVAALTLFAAVAWIGLMVYPDFVAYNAEHPTLLLLSTAGYCLARLTVAPPGRAGAWTFGIGLALGLVPLAKLQGLPIAVALVFIMAGVLAARRRRDGGSATKVASFVLGVAIPAVALAGYLWHQKLFHDFWTIYVLGNASYAANGLLSNAAGSRADAAVRHGRAFAFLALAYRWYSEDLFATGMCAWSLGAAGWLLTTWRERMSLRDWRLLGAAVFVALAAASAAFLPGNIFTHYLLFLFPALGLLAATVLATGIRVLGSRRHRAAFASTYALACVLMPMGWGLHRGNMPLRTPAVFTDAWPGSEVARTIRMYAREQEPLLVWGWMARYYVLTGMRQATRSSATNFELEEAPFQVARFIDALNATNPPVFVDAVGPGAFRYSQRVRAGHERYPWLLDWVAPRYQQVADIEGARVYVLKSRLVVQQHQ